ncbi:hypothetical protein VTK73DRAFT_2094 [Phialemonium thermophilum]|uniref:Uncharacterized protein n=1 Tax=Phialemonium thermophilum TaxID=223376 RepID=A0ABR3VSK1_9PEZI
MNTRLSGPHAAIHDEFWCTDAWLTPTDPEGRRNALPNLLWDNRPTRPDALKDGWVNVGDDGTCDGDTSAFTITHIWGGDIDVITFCQDRFAQWDQDQAQGRTVQDLCAAAQPQGTALDAVVGGKLATVMVHEFTHSLNLVQQKPTDTGESPISESLSVYIYLSIHPSIRLSIHLSIYPSIYLQTYAWPADSRAADQTCPGTTDRPAYGFGCIAALGRDKSQLAINNAGTLPNACSLVLVPRWRLLTDCPRPQTATPTLPQVGSFRPLSEVMHLLTRAYSRLLPEEQLVQWFRAAALVGGVSCRKSRWETRSAWDPRGALLRAAKLEKQHLVNATLYSVESLLSSRILCVT